MPAMFDLYYLFVETVFGNFFIAIAGLALFLLLIGALGRMSRSSIIIIVGGFVLTMAIGYLGALASLILFIVAATFFVISVLRWLGTT